MSGKTFYVYCAGKTNGAERQIVAQLKATGQIEVTSTENSDYLVVFCPVSSRVGTDIKDALDNVKGRKCLWLSSVSRQKTSVAHSDELTDN